MSPAATRNLIVRGSPNATIEIAAPTNGANEKYAPVRAVPRCRSARMKQTRLIPYPTKPTAAAVATGPADGHDAPSSSPTVVLSVPAARPLIIANCTGSEPESFRVRLLSIPHDAHAPTIA